MVFSCSSFSNIITSSFILFIFEGKNFTGSYVKAVVSFIVASLLTFFWIDVLRYSEKKIPVKKVLRCVSICGYLFSLLYLCYSFSFFVKNVPYHFALPSFLLVQNEQDEICILIWVISCMMAFISLVWMITYFYGISEHTGILTKTASSCSFSFFITMSSFIREGRNFTWFYVKAIVILTVAFLITFFCIDAFRDSEKKTLRCVLLCGCIVAWIYVFYFSFRYGI